MLSSSMKRSLVPALLLAGVQACSDNTGPDESLVANLQVAPAHVHSFETDVTFTATFANAAGSPVQDLAGVVAEIGPAGTDQWTKQVPLLFDGEAYVGSTKFTANGSFDARIVGRRPGQGEASELYRRPTPLESVRPHFDAGGYRVEFETDTGDYPVHGQAIEFRFLVMEDVPSPRPPVTGLSGVTIRCTQGSEVETHAATESPAGTYVASHVFTSAGEGTAQIEFTGLDLNPAVVQISLVIF
ncbi:MAG: hypothetical protein ACRDGR_10015 [bacterium]